MSELTNKTGLAEEMKSAKGEGIVTKKVNLSCNLRLRKGLVGLPNQSEDEFNYEIASVLAGSGGPLKGITGQLEELIMPSIVDVSYNDNTFNTHVKEYWANIGIPLPPDSENKRDTEQGIMVNLFVTLIGNRVIESFEKLNRLDEKFLFVHNLLEEQLNSNKEGKTVVLSSDYYAEFAKLAFFMKHSKIAKRAEDKDKSSKIIGYIYEKEEAVKAKVTEMETFNTFLENLKSLEDAEKINALLLYLKIPIASTDTDEDKKLIIFNDGKTQAAVRIKVNKFFKDNNWLHKYYVNQGIEFQILKCPTNSTIVQYADVVIGNTKEAAANHLKNTEEGKAIVELIKQKIKLM